MATDMTEWPSTPIPESIKTLIHDFYGLVDKKNDTSGEDLSEQAFTPDAQWVINNHIYTGTAEISAYGNREIIKDRLHTVSKVYSCGAGGDDLLMYGNLSMSLCNGTKVETGFCARCVVDMEVVEGPKIKYWQAWFDSGELQTLLEQMQCQATELATVVEVQEEKDEVQGEKDEGFIEGDVAESPK